MSDELKPMAEIRERFAGMDRYFYAVFSGERKLTADFYPHELPFLEAVVTAWNQRANADKE